MLGFTDRGIVADMLRDCQPNRPLGVHMAAASQPVDLAPAPVYRGDTESAVDDVRGWLAEGRRVVVVVTDATSMSMRGRRCQRRNAARFSASVRSSPAPPTK